MSSPPSPRLPDLSVLFPVGAWLRHPALRNWTTWLFVALVAVPPAALAVFADAPGLLGPSITYAAYFAVAWFVVLWVVVRPRRIQTVMVAQVATIEAVLVLTWLFAIDWFVPDLDNLLASTFLVGVPEELIKALPAVALALAYRRLSLPPREVLFLAATSGLVFGAIEAVVYAPTDGLLTAHQALTTVWRFATDPISHALWAGVAGYFVGLAAHYRTAGTFLALTGIGVGVPALLHGLNDWTPVTGNLWWLIVAVVSALLFLAYARVGLAARRPAVPAPAPTPVWNPSSPRRHAAVFTDPPTAPLALRRPGPLVP